jgi:integrase
MSVRKRTWTTRKGEAKESWIVDYTDQAGERHIHTFSRKKDADEYHATVKVDVRQGIHTAPSKSITVAEAAEGWLKRVNADGRERTTISQYRQHIDLHIAPRIGRMKLAQLTPPKVEAFRDDLLQNLSRPLARKVLTSLKSLLRAANHAHLATASIGPDKRSQRKLEAGRDIPTPTEVKRLIEAAPNSRLRALLLTAALAGLRSSELRGLRWSDVDFKAAEIHVRQRADAYGAIGSPKSGSSRRVIPFPPDVLNALKAWKLACPNGDLVFPADSGGVQHRAHMLRSVKSALLAARVVDSKGRPKYALHSLRHFFASWCVNPKERGGRELPPKLVQQLLGHSSIVMTLDRYGHLFPRGDDRAELAASAGALLA